ncbi:hypothetical protein KP509_34G002200 [Ceratopteris richardii]|uniref:Protein HEAT INTOLERANT 4 n=1 Tax=Ceratopteris richardii TaxID=49495 RepID=A0A8T2QID4_CERRI|nr:hypothetical protein KP509_34G002200 [Ceratopteris richardii]
MPRKQSRPVQASAPAPAPASDALPVSRPQKRHHVEEEVAPSSPLKDIWKEAFPVGTEWDQYDRVYELEWDFSHLEDAFEENGILHGKKVYLFGCTEPQFISFGDVSRVVHIPAVVAVVAQHPPSDKIGIKSVQMEGEFIVPMKQMKMDWVPYIPADKDHISVERYRSQIFTLKCVQRRVALKNLKEERLKKYEYCLPYFNNPLKEEELEPDTVVSIIFPFDDEKPPLLTDFDWELDDLEEMADNLVKDESLTPETKDAFKAFVKQKVSEERKQQRQAREERRKRIQEMNAETKAFYENIRFYKFYPRQSAGTPDISNLKSSFINRYYGKANEVF